MNEECNLNDVHKSIKAINADTVHKICSGQVVLSLAVAVKELVENSIDAGATNIDVRFKNYGVDLIEVSDNGSGVTEDNFSALTQKYHTSKLKDYSDLLGVESFGFRGEALSSLCALANLTITTRHVRCEHAIKIEYDHKGNITKKSPCSRQVGTTVSLSNLFYSLPVRQKEFHKNVKREFNKMTQLLYAYCLISQGIKITCSNQTSTNSKSIVVATQGSMSYKDNIACVFGLKQLHSILEIKPEHVPNIKENLFKGLSSAVECSNESVNIEDTEIDLSEDSNDAENTIQNSCDSITSSQKSQGYKNVIDPVEFTGYISSCAHGSGRSSTDRQFYYVNSRPCEPTKITKLINEVYRQYNSHQYPFVFLNVNLERTTVDVNVTPDKRKVFLTKEKVILDVLKSSLTKLFESIPRTLKIEQPSEILSKFTSKISDTDKSSSSFLQQFGKNRKSNDAFKKSDEGTSLELKRKSTTMLNFISSKIIKKVNEEIEDSKIDDDSTKNQEDTSDQIHDELIIKKEDGDSTLSDESNNPILDGSSPSGKNYFANSNDKDESTKDIMYLEYTDNLPITQIRKVDEVIIEKSHTIYSNTRTKTSKLNILEPIMKEAKRAKIVTDKEDLGKMTRKTVNLKTSLEHVKALANIFNNQKASVAPDRVKFKGVIDPVSNKKCEEELSKEISQDSFKQMEVIGQFNLGFIITKLNDDLFIIDQHATDEIYNFETLQKTTELTHQKLVIPQQLELTGVNEQILVDNLGVFNKNGFTFEIDENALPTKRVKLLTLPMSKNWVFGKEDIEELLFMLRESPSEHCRPSRVRSMFASRACRKSVMIGTALSKADMKLLVDHMAEIDKPWNCPHGRPTIRHLINLAMVHTKSM